MPHPIVCNTDTITQYLHGFAGSDACLADYLVIALARALRKHEAALQPVTALPADAPDWMRVKWTAGERDFRAFTPNAHLDGQVRHVADWIKAAVINHEPWLEERDTKGRPRRLLEIGTLETALAKADKAMRRRSGGLPLEEGDSDVRSVMELPNGFCIAELLTARALDRESRMLGHCIGNGAYDDKLGNGHRYYSLRDGRNQAHATFEVTTATHTLSQCKGKRNKPPVAKYLPYVRAFIERERFHLSELPAQTGLVRAADGGYHDLYHLPRGLSIVGDLDLYGCEDLKALPEGLTVGGHLNLYGCKDLKGLPEGLTVGGHLDLPGCASLSTLPQGLAIGGNLNLGGCEDLKALPEGLAVGGNLILPGCTSLTSLPQGLAVGGNLNLACCASLSTLPQGLAVGGHLDLGGCEDLKALPEGLAVGGHLILPGCTSLTSLPQGLAVGGNLILPGCASLSTLPQGLAVGGHLDLGGCEDLKALPEGLAVGRDLNLYGCPASLPRRYSVMGKVIGRSTPPVPDVRTPHHDGRLHGGTSGREWGR